VQILCDFGQRQTLIMNISRTDGDVQNRKDVIDSDSSCIRRKKSGEFGPVTTKRISAL